MKKVIKLIITLFIGFVIAALIAVSKDLFIQTSMEKIFHILTDSFFVPGVVITALGLLIFASNEGSFDIIVYGVQRFVGLFRKNYQPKYHTFYDYRIAHSESKLPFSFLIIGGVFFIAISMVMFGIYQSYV